MADPTEQMLAQLKQLLDGFKNVGQYSKDLASALASANRPMQEMSDMSKAISEHMRSMREEVKKSSEAVDTLSTQLKNVNQTTGEHNAKIDEAKLKLLEQQKIHEEWRTALAKARIEEREFYTQLTREGEERNKKNREYTEGLKDTASLWERIKRSAEEMQVASGGRGMATAAHALTGQASMQGAMQEMAGGLGSLAPTAGIGGLIGMMMYGKIKDEDFRAIGETAGQAFDQISGHTQKFSGQMRDLTRIMSVSGMAAKEDLVSVSRAFAQTGVTSNEAMKSVKGLSTEFGNNLVVASLAADKALELPAGSFARLSGTLSKDFNVSIDKAFIGLARLAQGAKEAGINAAEFMQQTMEAASSLRLLHANALSVGEVQLGLKGTMAGRGFNNAYSGQYAAAGMSSVTGAVAGLGDGLASIIGQKLGFGTGIEALYAMKTGSGASARGGAELDLINVMKEMKDVLPGGSRAEKAFAATKMFGVDYAGADAIIDAIEESAKPNADISQVNRLLHGAMVSESEKSNRIMQAVEQIKDVIAQVSSGLLSMILDVLKGTYHAIMQGVDFLLAKFGDTSKSDLRMQASDEHGRLGGEAFGGISAAADRMKAAMKGEGSDAMKKLLDSFGISGGWTSDKLRMIADSMDKVDASHAADPTAGGALPSKGGGRSGFTAGIPNKVLDSIEHKTTRGRTTVIVKHDDDNGNKNYSQDRK